MEQQTGMNSHTRRRLIAYFVLTFDLIKSVRSFLCVKYKAPINAFSICKEPTTFHRETRFRRKFGGKDTTFFLYTQGKCAFLRVLECFLRFLHKKTPPGGMA